MSKFPVELSDDEGQIDAINYLLSGPSGLGQNFAGFSSYTSAYLTGNYRTPFAQPGISYLYVAPISLGTCEMLDGRTWKYNFASTQATAPFSPGNIVTINGVTNDFYDGTYSPIGVASCTVDYVILRTSTSYDIEPPSSGGTASIDLMDSYNSTDCNARVTVTGATDRVFISGQLDQYVSYEVITGTPTMYVDVAVNRYVGFLNNDPVNPDYIFNLDEVVAQKTYTFESLTGTGTLPLIETVFATVLDQPLPGYYWYILEVQFRGTDIKATSSLFELRSLSSQVVKQ